MLNKPIKPFMSPCLFCSAGFCEEGLTQVSTLNGQNDFNFEVIDGPDIVSGFFKINCWVLLNKYFSFLVQPWRSPGQQQRVGVCRKYCNNPINTTAVLSRSNFYVCEKLYLYKCTTSWPRECMFLHWRSSFWTYFFLILCYLELISLSLIYFSLAAQVG